LRSNSKVVVKRTNFCSFFALPNFKGGGAPKSCTCVNTASRDTSSAKVLSGYTPNSEVIMAHLFHFKPIFDPPLKKVVRGPPSQVGGALVRLGHSLARVKLLGAQHPLGAKIWFSENCALGGYDFTSKSPRSLDQTSPYLFRLTQAESPYME